MTKHVSPERAGTELTGNEYIRALDGAIMVEGEPGWFVHSYHASAKRHAANDNAPRKIAKEVRPGKRRVRDKEKPKWNGGPSQWWNDLEALIKTRVTILGDGVTLRKVRIDAAKALFCDNVSLHTTYGKKIIWSDAVERWNIADLAEPENYRAVLECYRVEYPEKDYPEHTLCPTWSLAPMGRRHWRRTPPT